MFCTITIDGHKYETNAGYEKGTRGGWNEPPVPSGWEIDELYMVRGDKKRLIKIIPEWLLEQMWNALNRKAKDMKDDAIMSRYEE